MTTEAPGATPFSFRVKVGHVSHNPLEIHLEADERERAALAAAWKILGIESLSANLKIRRWKKDGVRVFGEIHGAVTQACVVTLEPVRSEIHGEIDQVFVPEGSPLARVPANDQGEILIDPDGPDSPDIFAGDTLDVGEVVAEFAVLELDPYPRMPGVEFPGHIEQGGPDEKKPSPFAVLKALKGDS
jgi:uncharacterized metal-binding protein YceD (DUF177 family)